jgi:serine/threonine protein kinase
MHQKGVVHRDMKPDNFLMGAGKKSNTVYLIDFGLSKIYMDPNTGNHFAQREKRINDLVGTARYCSIRSHLGLQLSRRDDLESLCHVLVYLAVPGLPWQGLHANSTKEKYDKIGKLKQSLSAAEICEGFSSCFERFLDYSRNLDFEEELDYDMCRGLFRECFQQYRIPDDDVFDWTHILGKGLLTIGVIGARGLLGKNSRGLSNPYCTVWVTTKGNKVMKEKTQIIEGNLTPLWDSLFEFPVSDDSAVLSIYVWSKSSGLMFRDRFLGRIVVPIDTLTEKTLLDDWHVLQKRNPKSNVAGDIHLRIYYRKGHPQT